MEVKWTPEMDDAIRQRFSRCSVGILAKELGVDRRVLSERAKILGVTRGYRIGGRYLTEDEVQKIVRQCKASPYSEVARRYCLDRQALFGFLRYYYPDVLVEQSDERRRLSNSRKLERFRLMHERQKLVEKAEKEKVARPDISPMKERVAVGEFYWLPSDEHIGAYRCRENGDPIDDYNFNRGWYFATESDATLFSKNVQKKASRYISDK